MILQENYKVVDDGIWISRKELEEWRDHYKSLYLEANSLPNEMLYIGKHDVIVDLLKIIEKRK